MVEYKTVAIAASRYDEMGAANGLKSGGIQSYEIRNRSFFPISFMHSNLYEMS